MRAIGARPTSRSQAATYQLLRKNMPETPPASALDSLTSIVHLAHESYKTGLNCLFLDHTAYLMDASGRIGYQSFHLRSRRGVISRLACLVLKAARATGESRLRHKRT